MKKTLFVTSLCLAVFGGAIELPPTSLNAQTPDRNPSVVQQPTEGLSRPVANSKSPQVELLNPGAEPRQQLRLKPAINVKETSVMTLTMEMGISTPDRTVPATKVPGTALTFETQVTKIDANGDIHYEFAYTNADVTGDTGNIPPAAIDSMRSTLKTLVGIKGSFIADDRGFYKGGNFTLPEGGDRNLNQMLLQMSRSLEQMSSPLPAEAVGKGAQWRVISEPNFMGMNVKNIATYELTGWENNNVSLNVTIEQQANPQNLTSPQLPAGATATLKSLTARGQGQATIRLDKLLPSRSTSSINSNSEMSVKVPNNSQEITFKSQLSMQMTLESK
ncbi:MAG: hypothetical protein HC849_25695 [Oscillatoriales cyanobacterium RU_3_3]|nr:hypothetical protein [Oscillatoriales cyanobacterium RU_3_3]